MTQCGNKRLGFAAPLLGPSSRRLSILYEDADLLVLEKPAGYAGDIHPWYPECPSITEAMRKQLKAPSAEWETLGIAQVRSLFMLDPDIEGALVLAKHKEASDRLRNDLGAHAFTFTFHLVVRAPWPQEALECTLPLAPHFREPRMVVSHKTGKKAQTSFRPLSTWGAYSLWEATTSYLRPHQLRLHALEVGLSILGEALYREVPKVYLSGFKKRYKGRQDERPLYEPIAIRLDSMDLSNLGTVRIPAPKPWKHMLTVLGQYA